MKKQYLKFSIILIISIIISWIISLRIQYDCFDVSKLFKVNISLTILCSMVTFFLLSHFIYKRENIYEFLYKKRYTISIIILFFLVIGKFSGSSIGIWNEYIEPSNNIDTTLVGKPRGIRSDEWLVNTPYVFSQEYNGYSYENDLSRGKETDMFTSIYTPINDILILTRPFNVGYLLLGKDYGLSFYWAFSEEEEGGLAKETVGKTFKGKR